MCGSLATTYSGPVYPGAAGTRWLLLGCLPKGVQKGAERRGWGTRTVPGARGGGGGDGGGAGRGLLATDAQIVY